MFNKMKELGGLGVQCHVPGEVSGIKGVIFGVPISLSDETLRNQLMSEKVIEVKRLIKQKREKRAKYNSDDNREWDTASRKC